MVGLVTMMEIWCEGGGDDDGTGDGDGDGDGGGDGDGDREMVMVTVMEGYTYTSIHKHDVWIVRCERIHLEIAIVIVHCGYGRD